MRQGDFVTIALQGDFGKPRPAQIIQADPFGEHAAATVLPVTSTLAAAPLLRITVQPSVESGLHQPSQFMVDKTVRRDKLGPSFGRIDADALVQVERCLAVFLGIAKWATRIVRRRRRALFPNHRQPRVGGPSRRWM